MSHHEKTVHAAKGKWRGILLSLGIPESALKDRHGPCPLCGGSDRFRWDNAGGRGTYICGQCGAGDGMKLAVEYTEKPFFEVASIIDGMLGNIKAEAPRPDMSPEKRRDILRDTYRATQAIQPDDLAHRYLESRAIDELIYPAALRFAPSLRDGDGGVRPAMVAMIGVHGRGKPVSMHRTFLSPDGRGKAEMASPRKMMPGELPDGACVMLCEYVAGGPLGIAEGIETAMSASALFDMPVWAAINSTLMAKWTPPDGCTEVAVFGDNDAKYGGQMAAYTLAHKLAVKGIETSVHIPKITGQDFSDIHMARMCGKAE
jgi:putative DNA primase/helicase